MTKLLILIWCGGFHATNPLNKNIIRILSKKHRIIFVKKCNAQYLSTVIYIVRNKPFHIDNSLDFLWLCTWFWRNISSILYVCMDLCIKLGPYKFSLQASVDHHGYSMNSGHYTASINCCGKTFHCNDNEITECNITDTYNSSTVCPFTTCREIGTETCGMNNVFPPDDL